MRGIVGVINEVDYINNSYSLIKCRSVEVHVRTACVHPATDTCRDIGSQFLKGVDLLCFCFISPSLFCPRRFRPEIFRVCLVTRVLLSQAFLSLQTMGHVLGPYV